MSKITTVSERLHQVILAPVVSEKSTRVAEKNNQVVFRVTRDAVKPEIKKAVEALFKVKVLGVRTLNVGGKAKGGGTRRPGQRSDWKKAYVTLAEGQQIDFTSGAAV